MSQEQQQSSVEQVENNQQMTKKLVVVVFIMLAFGFAMIPLYDVFCEITGLNGKSNGLAVYTEQEADTSREITVQFMTITKNDMPWEFHPVTTQMKVYPGQEYEVAFKVKNKAGKTIIGQAIPSFSPNLVSQYFNKTIAMV